MDFVKRNKNDTWMLKMNNFFTSNAFSTYRSYYRLEKICSRDSKCKAGADMKMKEAAGRGASESETWKGERKADLGDGKAEWKGISGC